MPIEFKPYLLLALHELDHFSVPGVGTFVRRREKARFDAETGQLYPPQEVTELKRGDDMLEAFVGFLAVKTGKPHTEAEALAREIGSTVVQFIQSLVDIELEGFGVLKKGAYNLPAFEPTEAEGVTDLFGLPAAKVGKLVAVAAPAATKPTAKAAGTPTPPAVPVAEKKPAETPPPATRKPETAPPAAPKPTQEPPVGKGPAVPTPSQPEPAAPAAPKLQPRKRPVPGRAQPARKKRSPLRLLLLLVVLGALGAGGAYVALNWKQLFGSGSPAPSESAATGPQEAAPAQPTPTPTDTMPQAPPPGAKKPSAFPGAQ